MRYKEELIEDIPGIWVKSRISFPHGFVTIYLDKETNEGIISNIFINPHARKVGKGTKLLTKAENNLKKQGASVLTMMARRDSFVYEWLVRRGYKKESKSWAFANEDWLAKPVLDKNFK